MIAICGKPILEQGAAAIYPAHIKVKSSLKNKISDPSQRIEAAISPERLKIKINRHRYTMLA